ncbi:MAG: hypothetical protein Q9165_008048 [Trypethelium subeluteriae]
MPPEIFRRILAHISPSDIASTVEVPQLCDQLVESIPFSDLPSVIREAHPKDSRTYRFIRKALSRHLGFWDLCHKGGAKSTFLSICHVLNEHGIWAKTAGPLWDLADFSHPACKPQYGGDQDHLQVLSPPICGPDLFHDINFYLQCIKFALNNDDDQGRDILLNRQGRYWPNLRTFQTGVQLMFSVEQLEKLARSMYPHVGILILTEEGQTLLKVLMKCGKSHDFRVKCMKCAVKTEDRLFLNWALDRWTPWFLSFREIIGKAIRYRRINALSVLMSHVPLQAKRRNLMFALRSAAEEEEIDVFEALLDPTRFSRGEPVDTPNSMSGFSRAIHIKVEGTRVQKMFEESCLAGNSGQKRLIPEELGRDTSRVCKRVRVAEPSDD